MAEELAGTTGGEPERRTLLDTIMRYEGRGGSVATILMIIGSVMVLIGGSAALSLLRQPWELDADSPVVESIDSECRPLKGGLLAIELGGRRYLCGGSDSKCGDEAPAPIAYDPEDPARCRLAANVDRLGDYELFGLLFVLVGLFAGAAGGAYRMSERLRRAGLAVSPSPQTDRRIALLRGSSGLALLVAIAISNGAGIFFIVSQR